MLNFVKQKNLRYKEMGNYHQSFQDTPPNLYDLIELILLLYDLCNIFAVELQIMYMESFSEISPLV